MKKASGIGSLSRVATVQRSITHDALEIAFDESGTGRPVVWLHGISEDRFSWAPVTEQLADEMRCIRIDFRGHGASSHRRPYELEALVSDVTSVISATCNEPPVVVGHSLGGMVATIAAAIGDTGPVICVDQPLTLEGFAEIVHSIAPRLRDPETYSDALMEEKLAIGWVSCRSHFFASSNERPVRAIRTLSSTSGSRCLTGTSARWKRQS
jgi:pimeloyl-ACP methyl ester carboxylesterase